MIRLEGLSKSFDGICAVDQVSCTIPQGQITILAGADGAGKSTIFKMIVGLVKRDGGEIYLNEEKIGSKFEKITGVTGYMPEKFSLYPDLSVAENMNFFADIHGVSRSQREQRKQELLEKTDMLPFVKRRAGALSGGMKQKLALSTILLAAPELIILDEPTTGVDPLSRIEFFNIIKYLKSQGKTILVSTPYLDEAEQGDHIIFLKNGAIIKQAPMAELKRNFPARLFTILPEGNVFDVMNTLEEKHPDLRHNFYVRGKHLKYLQTGDLDPAQLFPIIRMEEEKAGLEDIYIYYERHARAQHAGE